MYYTDDNTWARKRKNLCDGLDENMIVWDAAFSGDPFYYFHDGLGSVVDIRDGSGNQVKSYEYSAFGKTLSGVGQNRQIGVG